MPTRLTRDQKKAATRTALLESAASVFAELGFEAASIEEISERAGYSRGAFYANFASKEDCFLTVLAERGSVHLTDIAEAFGRGDSLAERLDSGGSFLDEHLDREREWCRLYMEAWSLATREPKLREVFAEQYRQRRREVASIIASHADDADPAISDLLASALIGLFEGYIMQELIDPAALPEDYFRQALRTLFLPLHQEGA